MKTAIKLFLWVIAGALIGFVFSAIMVVAFTDVSLSEFSANIVSADFGKSCVAAVVGAGAFILSLLILVPAHEAGHLVCGLLSGYKFVSFRIFNFTLIKIGGKLCVKRFSVAGTGGQCLLNPPDRSIEEIPTGWYNAGGVLANLIMLAAVLPLLWMDLHSLLFESLLIFCIVDLLLILTNGIPMKLGGIGNDAYNMIYLNKNYQSKRAVMIQLRSNALIQEGVRPKDMPAEWFECDVVVDYGNPLEVSVPIMYASRLVDEMRFEDAYLKFEELYSHKADIIQLYVNEIACELAFCALITGRKERAEELLDKKLRKYIDTYSKVMSSKQRMLCAISLYVDGNESKAKSIYNALDAGKENYLLQGEVKSDLVIMRAMLGL
ncbi:MAG: hypothetical protein NC248_07615 [Bacteroides sp.]|nr:hypothetical protein [Bacteroides sp.]MCM1389570.1 hypothetical protein [Bacteroides sp.]